MNHLVTSEWLADAIGSRDLRVVDATWFLPGDARDAGAEFATAHIPGAVFLDLNGVIDTASDLPMMLPDADRFVERMAAIGLGDDTRIVLYDNSPYHTAARAWVMFRAFGVPDAAILDGGFAKWRAEARAVESGTAIAKPLSLTTRASRDGIVDRDAMRAIVETGAMQIVDARSPTRFAGEEPEPRPGTVPGHISGSRNLPHGRLFAADGTWKRGDALREAFREAGVDPARPFVATCGSGVTASVLAFGAHLLGGEAAVYDGSWAEWGADPTTPKAIGRA